MYDLRTFLRSQYRAWCWLVVGCLLGAFQVAHASKLPDFRQTGATTTGNSARIGMTGNGVEWGSTIPISPVAGGWTYAGNYGVPQAAKGTTMNMTASGEVFFSGTKYPFQAAYTVPTANVWQGLLTAATFVGGAAGGYWGLASLVAGQAVPYIKQWFDDSNLRLKPENPNIIQHGDDVTYCGTPPCYEYRAGNQPWNNNFSPEAACRAYEANWLDVQWPGLYNYLSYSTAYPARCYYNGTAHWTTLESRSRPPDTNRVWTDLASLSDIAPYMQAKPFDPRVVPEILNNGGDIPMPNPTITGPASLPGPSQVIRNPDGSTTTINTTNNYTINGNTITNNSQVTNSTTVNSSNVTTSTSSTTINPSTNAPTAPVQDVCSTNPGSIMCAPRTLLDTIISKLQQLVDKNTNVTVNVPAPVVNVPAAPAPVVNVPAPVVNVAPPVVNIPEQQTDCDKKPNSIGCQEFGTPPTDEVPKSTVELTYQTESHFGGGSCPSDKSMQIRNGPSVVVADWGVVCDQITTWVRPLLLTLAAFGALMVLAPGLREGTA